VAAVAAQERHFPVLDEIETVVGKLTLRAVSAAAQAVHAVGEVNRAIRLHHNVIRAAEALAFVAIGQ
jgi:hypothetical protein